MREIRRPLLWGCLALIAVIALWQRLANPPPWESELSPQFLKESQGKPVTVTGQVYGKEVRTLYGKEILFLYLRSINVSSDTESGDGASVPDISVQTIKSRLVCQLAAGHEASVSQLWERTNLGSRVAVQGQLELYQHATNPGEWDSADYNLIIGVAGQLKQASLLGSDNGRWRIREALARLRYILKERLYQALPSREASVLAKMLLGEKYELDQELKELYQNNGIAHVLAISGMHITLLGMGFYGLLRRCSCPIVPAAVAGGCMILLYGGMVGWGISAVRAIGMYLIRMLGEIWGKRYDMLTAMGVLAAGMVCHNPRLVYHCGFLLSFGAVAGMGLVYPSLLELPVNAKIEQAIRRERLAGRVQESKEAKGRINKSYWKIRGLLWLRGLLGGLQASLSIALATLPVQLYFFYQFPVYGILLNLVVLPLMGLLLAGGLVLIVIPAVLPVQWGVMGILALYEGICRWAECLPGHLWITGCPKTWQIVGYYGILTASISLLKISGKNSASASGPKNFAAGVLRQWGGRISLFLLTAAVIFLTRRWGSGFAFTMLDVGQGDCICVHTARGRNYLFDGGSSSRSHAGEYVLIPYLKYQGIHTIDGIFLSHGDQDHVNAIRELLSDSQGIQLRVLYLPQVAEPLPEQLEELRQLAREAGCRVEYLSQGKGWQQGDFRLTCLWPQADYRGESNASSACYLLEESDFRVLLTGDVEGEGERELAAYLRTLSLPGLDVLKVAHHGSRYSTPAVFLEAAAPRLALISAGRDNSYGHPHEETLQRLDNAGCLILQTTDGGAITVRYIHNKIVVEKFR
ncbi:MAG: DNA internalization-related competence protein ComEC/Rec2 [Acetatifactor sp.]|nr:DNA internalization-related competence protein ComEC/Rec2 [Acetatifactor sp.]